MQVFSWVWPKSHYISSLYRNIIWRWRSYSLGTFKFEESLRGMLWSQLGEVEAARLGREKWRCNSVIRWPWQNPGCFWSCLAPSEFSEMEKVVWAFKRTHLPVIGCRPLPEKESWIWAVPEAEGIDPSALQGVLGRVTEHR